jgi:hypothetical protein
LAEKVDSLQIERMTDGNETSDFNHEKEEMVMLLIVEVYSLK